METLELMEKLALSDDGNTSLHLTVKNKKLSQQEMIETLRTLLDKGFDFNSKNESNETVLQIAVANRMIDAADFLIERKASFCGVAHFFIDQEHENFEKLIVENCKSTDIDVQKMESESAKFVEWMISRGFDFDCKEDKEHNALFMAIGYNLQHILPVLLKNTKNINATDEKNRTLLRAFLESNTDEHKYGAMRKKSYSERHEVDIVKTLLDKGSDAQINAKEENGMSLIHVAAMKANISVVRILIVEYGANVNCRNSNKETPLHLAITNSDVMEVIKLLLENGANVNAKDSKGLTTLHKVAMNRSKRSDQILQMLLQYGADINAEDLENRTVLYCARLQDSQHHLQKCMEYVLAYNLDRQTEYWQSSYDYFDEEMTVENCDLQDFVSSMVIILAEHANKLKAVDLPWDEMINSLFRYIKDFCEDGIFLYESLNEHYVECLEEVKKLECTFIDGRMSLYTLFHMDPIRRCTYINNEKWQQIINSLKLEKDFPKYSDLILANYHEVVTRKVVIKLAKEAWLELTKIPLPDICIECILTYLSNSELFRLIENDD